ncbi:phage integrase N-terminal SAM-like domain-containing protein [Cytobacillus kochii]
MEGISLGYIENYREILRGKGLKDSTIKQYLSDLGEFLYWMAKYKDSFDINTLQSLTGQDLEAYVKYLSNKSVSDATFRRLVTVLTQFLKHQQVQYLISQKSDR